MFARLRRPLQIVVTDAESARPARRLSLIPIRWIGAGLALLAAAFALGVWAGRASVDRNRLAFEAKQLARERARLKAQLADREAELEMRARTIEALRAQIHDLEARLTDREAALLTYRRILDARKTPGIQIVEARAQMRDGVIRYRIALVKGGNYPRWASGRLVVRAIDADGAAWPVHEGRFRFETHAILGDRWSPPAGKRIEAIEVAVYDRSGREVTRTRVPLSHAFSKGGA